MSAYLKLGQTEDANGDRFPANRDSGRSGQIFIPAPMINSATFGQSVGALRSSVSIFAIGAEKLMESLSPVGWKPQASKQLEPTARAAGALLRNGRERKVELVQRREDWLAPVKRNVTDANRTEEVLRQMRDAQREVEIRNYLRSLKTGELVRAIFDNSEFAAAVIDFPALSGIPAELIERLEDTVIVHNLTQRFAVHDQRKASATDLFSVGNNNEAARERASAAITAYKKDVEEVAAVETVLNDTIDYIAVVADISRFAAFDMVAA